MEKKAELKPIEAVREMIAALVNPVDTEIIPLSSAMGRILAADVAARMDSPAFDHSSMDGCAIASDSCGPHTIIREIAAGSPPGARLEPGHAARIFTGAPVPEGTFCIVRQEDCICSGNELHIAPGVVISAAQNIRRRGGAFRRGDPILPAGKRISAGDVALLASCGNKELQVRRRLEAMHIVTGSELRDVAQTPPHDLAPGQIFDCNGPMISALMQASGANCKIENIVDDRIRLEELIAGFHGEILLISGGSGPGDHDHTTAALEKNGFEIHVSRVNSRPGKPMIFGTKGSIAAFGLPGNPLSHWVCFHVFVEAAIAAANGLSPARLIWADFAGGQFPGGDGRRTWTPARHWFRDGRLCVEALPWAHSGDLLPLARATALVLDEPNPATGRILTLIYETHSSG